MKISFNKLPDDEGTVKVSLDGGNTFIDHQINTVRKNGIPLADSQDYSKILIKGSANVLRNLDILSSVKVDGATQGTGTTYKAWTYEHNSQVIYTKNGSDVAYIKTSDNTVEEFDTVSEHTEDNGLERVRIMHTKGYWYRTPDQDFTVNEQTVGIPYTYEKPVYGLGTVTYKCYAWDPNSDGQITEDDNLSNNTHLWVKNVNDENVFYTTRSEQGLTDSVADLVLLSDVAPADLEIELTDDYFLSNRSSARGLRYPEGDLTNEEEGAIVGTETVTEVIKFIQDPPTVTENGTVIADEGKAFKSATVEVSKSELGFKCFYSYAPEHYFGEVPQAAQAFDSGDRYYNILMSNDYLSRMYKRVFPSRTYNGVVGLIRYDLRGNEILNNYQTLSSEYNLFSLQTKVGRTTVQLTFYDDLNASERQEAQIKVYLDSGEEYTVPTKELSDSTVTM